MQTYLMALLASVLLILTLPATDLDVFAWIALVPLLFALGYEYSMRRVVMAGLLYGTVYGVAVLYPLTSLNAWWWMSDNPFWYAHRYEFIVVIVSATAFALGGGPFALFAYLYKRAIKWPIWALAPAAGVVWALIERVRESLALGFTWGHLGYALADTPVAPLAAIVGVYGLSAVIIMVNILFARVMEEVVRVADWRRTAPYLALPLLVVALLSWMGFALAGSASALEQSDIAIVHTGMKTEESSGLIGYQRTMALLDEALEGGPDMVVLPENAFPFIIYDKRTSLPLGYDNTFADIKTLYDGLMELSAAHASTTIIMGIISREDQREYNSFAVVEGGAIVALSDKQALLPFAEEPWFFNEGHVNAKVHGAAVGSVPTMHGPVSPLICSEIIYPHISHDKKALVVNIANDAVFDSGLPSKQNHVMALMRAAERRAYLVRSVKGGTSSVIDPYGRVIVHSKAPFEAEIIRATIAW